MASSPAKDGSQSAAHEGWANMREARVHETGAWQAMSGQAAVSAGRQLGRGHMKAWDAGTGARARERETSRMHEAGPAGVLEKGSARVWP